MFSYTRITLAAALVFGAASPGLAKDKAPQNHTARNPAGHSRAATPGFDAYALHPVPAAQELYIRIQDQGYRDSIGD